ncbi:MAG: hypothetical protein ACFWUC_13160 [Oscillospiraceae bacterium]
MFVEKLNKKQDGVYVIEEEKVITDGKWEGYLDHDNVNHESVTIYTGSKLTGEKVQNYFISTPSETPWKTYLKVFSESKKIYIAYETSGDQVEAEDINQVQESIADTRTELEQYKTANDNIVGNLDTRLATAENDKAEKTYVDTELFKKADKTSTYTKDETDSRIQAIIGTAPDALDTLAEIAEALNNDPDFAATVTNLLAQKVDKVAGKGLSTEDFTTVEKEKLAGIEEGANKYIHPSAHPASMITESSSRRFVSNTEKANWNAKETPDGSQKKANIAEENAKAYADSIKPTKLSQLQNDAGYITSQRPISDSVTSTSSSVAASSKAVKTAYDRATNAIEHISDTNNPHRVTAEQVGAETPAGAQAKADAAENNAKKYTDENAFPKTGGTLNVFLKIVGTAADRHLTTRGIGGCSTDCKNIDDLYVNFGTDYGIKVGRSGTFHVNGNGEVVSPKLTGSPTAPTPSANDNSTRIATTAYVQNVLSDVSAGDMLKSVYDTDGDGVVDNAEVADNVLWSGITGKPSTYPPSNHTHSISNVSGLQSALDNKMPKGPITWNDLKGV